jgi:hypothetical protein
MNRVDEPIFPGGRTFPGTLRPSQLRNPHNWHDQSGDGRVAGMRFVSCGTSNSSGRYQRQDHCGGQHRPFRRIAPPQFTDGKPHHALRQVAATDRPPTGSQSREQDRETGPADRRSGTQTNSVGLGMRHHRSRDGSAADSKGGIVRSTRIPQPVGCFRAVGGLTDTARIAPRSPPVLPRPPSSNPNRPPSAVAPGRS